MEGVPLLLWASDILPQVEWDVMALSSPTLPALTLENQKVPCWGEGFPLRVVTRGCDGFGCSEVGCVCMSSGGAWGCVSTFPGLGGKRAWGLIVPPGSGPAVAKTEDDHAAKSLR